MEVILLDTNAYVALLQGHRGVLSLISQTDRVALSTVVLGELLFGFRNGSRFQDNLRRLQSFLAEPEVVTLPVSLTTADHYGIIAASLRSQGTPIPVNDIWIAAHAKQSGAALLTFDSHFQKVEGLKLADPG